MTNKINNQSGVAMILVLISIIIIVAALGLVVALMSSTTNNVNKVADIHLVEEACKGGIDFAIERLWNQYVIGNGNTTGNLASYRFFIDELVPQDSSIELLDDPLVIDPDLEVIVDSITIQRTDSINGIQLTIQALGEKSGTRQRVEQTVRVSGEPFAGFEYCVLANNINCILCHAGFYSLEQMTNSDEDLYGTFDRVKVATLEALLYRPSSADSRVAGSVYTRGGVYNETWSPRTPAQVASSDFNAFGFSDVDGKLFEDMDPNPKDRLDGPHGLSYSGVDGDGRPQPFDSLYMNYPTDPDLMTDGPLPATFPAPFPDNDGDRYIDDDEFEEIATRLDGSIQGGIAYGVPHGDTYPESSLPPGSNAALGDLAGSGRYDGNVVLVGTDANPIVIDGEVAINGDLVLQGKIKGRGQMFVRGNTYITGDVTYADAPGQFGVATDGTENAFGLVTGGSVLMGDYLTIRGKNFSWEDSAQYPSSSQSIRAREAHKTKTSTKNGVTETINYGYFDPGVIDAGEIQDTMIDADGNEVRRQGQQFSFTQSELQLFNMLELDKAMADPNYVPRFYGLRETQPDNIYVFTNSSKEEHVVKYDRKGSELLTEYLIDEGIDPSTILDRAAFHYMNPDNYWMDYDTLRQIWWDDEMSRTKNNDTSKVRFDGLIYSNNAIFAITRSKARKGSYTQGKMEVRGAFIAPDLGVLVPGPDQRGNESFTMMYDPRVRTFWAPADTTRSFFERVAYRFVPVSST